MEWIIYRDDMRDWSIIIDSDVDDDTKRQNVIWSKNYQNDILIIHNYGLFPNSSIRVDLFL